MRCSPLFVMGICYFLVVEKYKHGKLQYGTFIVRTKGAKKEGQRKRTGEYRYCLWL